MAARKRKVALSDDWKANIQSTQLMTRLFKHSVGEVEMTQSQINAAKIVLAKILPDLKSMELTGETKVTHVVDDKEAMKMAKEFLLSKHGDD